MEDCPYKEQRGAFIEYIYQVKVNMVGGIAGAVILTSAPAYLHWLKVNVRQWLPLT